MNRVSGCKKKLSFSSVQYVYLNSALNNPEKKSYTLIIKEEYAQWDGVSNNNQG